APARSDRLRAAGRSPGRSQEQSRVRFVRGGEKARNRAGTGRSALRPANLGWPADLASGERRRGTGRIATGRAHDRPRPRSRGQAHSSAMNENPIIVALDLDSAAEARELVNKLGDRVGFYKVGLELFAASGMEMVRELESRGKDVFLDLKLFD